MCPSRPLCSPRTPGSRQARVRLVSEAKIPSAVRGKSTKKRRAALTVRTETWTTPRGYCAVKDRGVPWCDKGFRDSSKPRITLRVGKFTIGDGSYVRVGSP
ncbi:hypothetical protein GCM10010392_02650 [Streptomyces clavifer]|nr:hypothetical protein GCM10010392_02650 [Streptomyces clavifer]